VNERQTHSGCALALCPLAETAIQRHGKLSCSGNSSAWQSSFPAESPPDRRFWNRRWSIYKTFHAGNRQ
jgi:hypothetical protein